MSKIVTIEDIKKAGSGKAVEIPGWGGEIRIKKATPAIRKRMNDLDIEDMTLGLYKAHLVFECTVEPDFDSVETVAECPDDGVSEAFEAICIHSGFERTVDEAEKNSETTPDDNSSSDSSPTSDTDQSES